MAARTCNLRARAWPAGDPAVRGVGEGGSCYRGYRPPPVGASPCQENVILGGSGGSWDVWMVLRGSTFNVFLANLV